MIDWPSEHVIKNNTLQDLADHAYDGLNTGIHSESYFNDRTILAARNDVVINLNIQLIQRMPGQAVEKLSADNVVDPAGASKSRRGLKSIFESGLPPHVTVVTRAVSCFSSFGITSGNTSGCARCAHYFLGLLNSKILSSSP